jgi:hypothetical protein
LLNACLQNTGSPSKFPILLLQTIFKQRHRSMRGKLLALRQLAAAASVPDFLQVIDTAGCKLDLEWEQNSNEYVQRQQQGYSGLLFSALAKGLQLYNSRSRQSATAEHLESRGAGTVAPKGSSSSRNSSSSSNAVSQGAEALCEQLQLLALACMRVLASGASYWEEQGWREVQKVVEEFKDAGELMYCCMHWIGCASCMDALLHALSTDNADTWEDAFVCACALTISAAAACSINAVADAV